MTAPISNGPTTHGYTTMRDATFNWPTAQARKGDEGFNPTQVDTSKGSTGFKPTRAQASKGDSSFTRKIYDTRAQPYDRSPENRMQLDWATFRECLKSLQFQRCEFMV